MYVRAVLLFIVVRTVLLTDHDCHSSVLFHRSDSILPSTDLFCVVHSNQEAVDNVPIIQTPEQWSNFAKENPILQEQQAPQTSLLPVLLRRKAGEVSEFLLPFSLLDSKCTGAQPVVLGFSQSVACSPPITVLTEVECRSNEFLSAQSLFGSPLISALGNISAETDLRWNSSLLSTQWKKTRCENVIKKISAKITLNETLIVDAQLTSIDYVTITVENFTDLIQEFRIDFKNSIASTAMDERHGGYKRGHTIYATNDGVNTFPLPVPQSGPCQSNRQLPVRFLVNSTTACTLSSSQCTEVKQRIQRIIKEIVPTWIRSSPVVETNATDAMVTLRNRTQTERITSANCLLVTNLLITIYYAKQGTQTNHRLVIVSGIYDMGLEPINVSSNSTVALRFKIEFKNVTPNPSIRFVSLPHIELRLPNDFFYPFVRKSATTPLETSFLALIYFFIHNSDVL